MTVKPWIAGLDFVVTAGNTSAQTGVDARRGGNLLRRPPKSVDPYAKLFANVQAELGARAATAQPQPTCYTMRLVPADPGIDPGIQVGGRSDHTRYAIRVVPLPTCK